MTLYEELKARGLVAQITDEEIIDLINNGKATFYIGFDCTADSLTAGHFLALTLMKRLQLAGNKPIALIGGGTTMIGEALLDTVQRRTFNYFWDGAEPNSGLARERIHMDGEAGYKCLLISFCLSTIVN